MCHIKISFQYGFFFFLVNLFLNKKTDFKEIFAHIYEQQIRAFPSVNNDAKILIEFQKMTKKTLILHSIEII